MLLEQMKSVQTGLIKGYLHLLRIEWGKTTIQTESINKLPMIGIRRDLQRPIRIKL